MVIVKLIGGLGNQLFQYAAGLQLAKLRQTTLKLDVQPFEYYKLHQYSLAAFQLRAEFATPREVAKFTGSTRNGLSWFVFKVAQKLKPVYRRKVIKEDHFRPYNPTLAKAPKEVYLDGYWQSEKYFAETKSLIRQEFTIKIEPDPLSRQIAKQIAETHSISIHIRRGDYISNSVTNKVHGVTDLNYYHECVKRVAQKVISPHFFVFSDDSAWVSENLWLDCPTTFVTHNDAAKNYEDLRLMSLCKHNIIANSTFSWWGAWLNANPDKMVFAPARWFNDSTIDTRDLFPDNWIKV